MRWDELAARLSSRLVGQPQAIERIIPYVRIYQSGLSPDSRPVGVFLLLGPSGTGKTKTVEALADVIHGNEKNVLRVDCGEFQMEHEVAKLIGAPPGYLGHRETHPLLTQQKLNAITSERSNLSIVLFDEIEKAAGSLSRLLLGVLDKATLKLGDNTAVNFERSLIFMTSNLGAREMFGLIRTRYGFASEAPGACEANNKIEQIGIAAVKRRFAPEFVNRIDSVISFRPLGSQEVEQILSIAIDKLRVHLARRLGARAFALDVAPAARRHLIERGISQEYGARELNRTIHRELVEPLAAMIADESIAPGQTAHVRVRHGKLFLTARNSSSQIAA